MTKHLIGTNATLTINGFEDVPLLVKDFPWPSTVGVDIAAPGGDFSVELTYSAEAGCRAGLGTKLALLRYLIVVERSMLEGDFSARAPCLPPSLTAQFETPKGIKPQPNRRNLNDRWGRLK